MGGELGDMAGCCLGFLAVVGQHSCRRCAHLCSGPLVGEFMAPGPYHLILEGVVRNKSSNQVGRARLWSDQWR